MRGLRPRSPSTITAVRIELVPVTWLEQRRAGSAPDSGCWTDLGVAWTGRRPGRPEGSYTISAAAGRCRGTRRRDDCPRRGGAGHTGPALRHRHDLTPF